MIRSEWQRPITRVVAYGAVAGAISSSGLSLQAMVTK